MFPQPSTVPSLLDIGSCELTLRQINIT